ncbi:thiamine ABC transporter substrate-binding protein [Escherichia coli]
MALEDGVFRCSTVYGWKAKTAKPMWCWGWITTCWTPPAKPGCFAKSGVATEAVNVPGGWKNDTFVPFDYGYFAFVYDKNKLKNPPQKPERTGCRAIKTGGVIYEDPRTSTPGLGLLLWMQKVYGDNAPASLAETGEENCHGHQRLERSLRPVF